MLVNGRMPQANLWSASESAVIHLVLPLFNQRRGDSLYVTEFGNARGAMITQESAVRDR
jgi:hypothetical protein